jgi:hypothetical protein
MPANTSVYIFLEHLMRPLVNETKVGERKLTSSDLMDRLNALWLVFVMFNCQRTMIPRCLPRTGK